MTSYSFPLDTGCAVEIYALSRTTRLQVENGCSSFRKVKSDGCSNIPRESAACSCSEVLRALLSSSLALVRWYELVLYVSSSHEKISCQSQSVVTLLALSEQACRSRWVPPASTSETEIIITPKSHFFPTFSSASKNWRVMFIFWLHFEFLFSKLLPIDLFSPADENTQSVECDEIYSNSLHKSNSISATTKL